MTLVKIRISAYCSEAGEPLRYRVQYELSSPEKGTPTRSGAPYEKIEQAAPAILRSLAFFNIENPTYEVELWQGNYTLGHDEKPREHTRIPEISIKDKLLALLEDKQAISEAQEWARDIKELANSSN